MKISKQLRQRIISRINIWGVVWNSNMKVEPTLGFLHYYVRLPRTAYGAIHVQSLTGLFGEIPRSGRT